MNSYILTKPKKYNEHDSFDLDTGLQQMTFNEIIQNPDEHFEKTFITNFDLIHHQCRGDELSHSREYYETLFKKKINSEIDNIKQRDSFVSTAINSEQKDVYIEKTIHEEHFNRTLLREKLNKNGVFLSNMRRKKMHR